MDPLVAAVVDAGELAQTVAAALLAGVGITAAFSLVIVGVARYSELRRDDRMLAATAFGGLAVLAMAVTIAAIAIGMVAMLSK